MPDDAILVGVPCYKDGPMVDRCLRSLAEPGVQLLLVDNGSDPDVKQAIAGRGIVIHNDVNRYVNPAWNQIMEIFLKHPRRWDILVIANSDLVLDPGWSMKLREHRARHPLEQILFGVDSPRQRRSAGAFFALSPRAVLASYPIPNDLLIMGGDDFIFYVNLGVGHEEHVVPSISMTHVERGTYDKAPEVWDIARRDTDRWNARGLQDLVPRRIRRLLSLPTAQSYAAHVQTLYAAHLESCFACHDDEDCPACGGDTRGPEGHACNCPEGGGGRGHRLRKLRKEARRESE